MLGFSSGRFVRERARVGPRPWSRIRKQFLARGFALAAWPSWRPAVARGERIGGGPVHHAGLTEPKRLAGPSAPSLATPHAEFDLTPRISTRAERRRCTRLPTTVVRSPAWVAPSSCSKLAPKSRSVSPSRSLAVGLQAVAALLQQHRDCAIRDGVILRVNSSANLAVLLQVQRNGDIGSPRVEGSINRSNAFKRPGSA